MRVIKCGACIDKKTCNLSENLKDRTSI